MLTDWLSDDKAVDQAVHRVGQKLPLAGYVRLQEILDKAISCVLKGDTRLVYFQDRDDVAVTLEEGTQGCEELCLVSLCRSSRPELNAAIKGGHEDGWRGT